MSPEKYKAQKDMYGKPSEAMKLGTSVHSVVLEPEKFNSDILVQPEFKGKGSVAARKEWKESIPTGTTIIDQKQYETTMRISDSFQSRPELTELLSGGEAEVTVLFEIGDLECKVRPDYLSDIIIDLKTTSKPLTDFNKACVNFNYHLSAYYYCLGCDMVDYQKYKFLVVETFAPYAFVIFSPDYEFFEAGKEQVLKALDILKFCKKHDMYPSVELEQTLSLPGWYRGK